MAGWSRSTRERTAPSICPARASTSAYLEDWTDCLFSWIRFFLVGDFWWQRREELQGYADYRGVFEELQTERGSAEAEEATFDAVLSTFSQHAEHWIGEVQSLAKAEKAEGRLRLAGGLPKALRSSSLAFSSRARSSSVKFLPARLM